MTDRPTIAEEAVLPEKPASPSLPKNTAIGGILGLLLVAAIVVVRFLLDDTIKTEEDVQKYLQLNTLAACSINRGNEGETKRKRRSA